MLVQLSKRPEYAIVGMKCRVLMPTKWIGGQYKNPIIDCPAVIMEVRKTDDVVTSIRVDIRRSRKYKNSSVDGMLIVKSQFDDVFVDTVIETTKEIKKENITLITKSVV